MVNYGRINAVLTPRGVAGGQLNPKKNLRGVLPGLFFIIFKRSIE